jgi:hypothetical protein
MAEDVLVGWGVVCCIGLCVTVASCVVWGDLPAACARSAPD